MLLEIMWTISHYFLPVFILKRKMLMSATLFFFIIYLFHCIGKSVNLKSFALIYHHFNYFNSKIQVFPPLKNIFLLLFLWLLLPSTCYVLSYRHFNVMISAHLNCVPLLFSHCFQTFTHSLSVLVQFIKLISHSLVPFSSVFNLFSFHWMNSEFIFFPS